VPVGDGNVEGRASFVRFARWLVVAIVLGVVLRVAYDLVVMRHVPLGTDSVWYILQGGTIHAGAFYVDPAAFYRGGHRVATAAWPPGFPLYLALVRSIAGGSVRAHELSGVIPGAATIALIGVLGRQIAGWRVGVVAALLAACSPLLIAVDGSVMSETLFIPLVVSAMVLAQMARGDVAGPQDQRRDAPWWLWLVLGAVIGVAALVRQDGIFLVPFLVVPAAILSSRHSARRCLARIAASVVAVMVVLAPWAIRNVSEFGEPTLSTLSSSTELAGSNCDQTFYGADLGIWNFSCIHEERARRGEEAYARSIRSQAIDYVESHLDRVPIVAAARVLRVWQLWDPVDQTRREALETRNRKWQYLATGCALAALVAGLVGIVILARNKRPVALLISMLAMVTTLAMLANGNTRFRSIAEPALLVGVGSLVITLWDRWRANRGSLVETARPEPQMDEETTSA
jgi:hypothetical protein